MYGIEKVEEIGRGANSCRNIKKLMELHKINFYFSFHFPNNIQEYFPIHLKIPPAIELSSHQHPLPFFPTSTSYQYLKKNNDKINQNNKLYHPQYYNQSPNGQLPQRDAGLHRTQLVPSLPLAHHPLAIPPLLLPLLQIPNRRRRLHPLRLLPRQILPPPHRLRPPLPRNLILHPPIPPTLQIRVRKNQLEVRQRLQKLARWIGMHPHRRRHESHQVLFLHRIDLGRLRRSVPGALVYYTQGVPGVR